MLQLEEIVDNLRNNGLRITPQRIAIIKYVTNTQSHPSAEEIHKVIQKKYPMVSMATVYKTLDLLRKMSMVQELGFADGSARYEANTARHINIICMCCGRIDDIDEHSLSTLESQVAEKSKYEIFGRRFELYGFCSECKLQKRDSN
jgi:Fur family transcriptional regulator, peroxide stress response regulator